ncbi:hypothetical protein CHARACLAT_018985 [Characodon lateralis]|uniref:Uncharacterized protein n=1 Tax=Characodon lateralis TaxID=208331 RepID=A0ABU7DUL1_9TELE|nr:hypothetical protein [Characodon lateralis]
METTPRNLCSSFSLFVAKYKGVLILGLHVAMEITHCDPSCLPPFIQHSQIQVQVTKDGSPGYQSVIEGVATELLPTWIQRRFLLRTLCRTDTLTLAGVSACAIDL